MEETRVIITTEEYKHLIKIEQKYDWLKTAIYKAAQSQDGHFTYISSTSLERALELVEPVLIQLMEDKAIEKEAEKAAEGLMDAE